MNLLVYADLQLSTAFLFNFFFCTHPRKEVEKRKVEEEALLKAQAQQKKTAGVA
jgi:hypothetical protein